MHIFCIYSDIITHRSSQCKIYFWEEVKMANMNNGGAEFSAEELDLVTAGSTNFDYYILRGICFITDGEKVIDRVSVPDGASDCVIDSNGKVHFIFD